MNEWMKNEWTNERTNEWMDNPEDGEMNQMTLLARHRIQDSSPGATLPLCHGGTPQYGFFMIDQVTWVRSKYLYCLLYLKSE